jgi:hypothetical protein
MQFHDLTQFNTVLFTQMYIYARWVVEVSVVEMPYCVIDLIWHSVADSFQVESIGKKNLSKCSSQLIFTEELVVNRNQQWHLPPSITNHQ